MDYSIGSLSDLITGKNTLNKPKVIRKQVTIRKNVLISNENSENSRDEEDNTSTALNKKESIKDIKHFGTQEKPVKKNKKRKALSYSEGEPKSKKSKNHTNAEKRIADKEKRQELENPETLLRTVFVGNVPISLDAKKIRKLFMKYGKVETVRIRGIPVANPKTPKKVAVIKKEFHPDRKSVHCYVRFEQHEDAVKAANANGMICNDHHLIIRLCSGEKNVDETKAIFVGNLSFYAEEEDLWKLFESCGTISSVRIVRDRKTGIGKGFGYINFKNSDSVTLALEMENIKLKDRELRLSICNINTAKKNKKKNKIKKINKAGKSKTLKKETQVAINENVDNKKKAKPLNTSFQGVKFSAKKKKNKLDKGLMQKKKIIKKVAPKQYQ